MGTQKDGFIAFVATEYICYKRAIPKGYRPMLYAVIVALRSLPSVALSSTITVILYANMLLPLKR
jgi:hypothetical protein